MKKKILFIALFQAIFILNLVSQSTTFQWVKELDYDEVGNFSCSLASFKKGELYGYINSVGDEVIAAKYDEVTPFSEGVAAVRKGNMWGYIDALDKIKRPFIFSAATPFKEGVAVVTYRDKQMFIFENGKNKSLGSGFKIYPYSNGLARFEYNGRIGFINMKGKEVIPAIYTGASDFNSGYAIAYLRGKPKLINMQGQDMKFNLKGEDLVVSEMMIRQMLKGFWVYRSAMNENILIEGDFQETTDFKEGLAAVKVNNKWGYIDNKGTIVIPYKYDKAFPFEGGHAAVLEDGKWGIIDKFDNLLLPCDYAELKNLGMKKALTTVDNRLGVISFGTIDDTSNSMLSVEEFKLVDDNNDAKLDAEESVKVRLRLRNISEKPLKNIIIEINETAKSPLLGAFSTKINEKEILPGEYSEYEYTIDTDEMLPTGVASLSLFVLNERFLSPILTTASIETKKIEYPQLTLDYHLLQNTVNKQIMQGDTVKLAYKVTNIGKGKADSILVQFALPAVFKAIDVPNVVETLPVGESISLTSLFLVEENLSNSPIDLSIAITEKRGKYGATRSFALSKGDTYLYYDPTYVTAKELVMKSIDSDTLSLSKKINLLRTLYYDRLPKTELDGALDRNVVRADRFALIIGNEDYSLTNNQKGYSMNIDYAVQDARSFANYAEKTLAIPPTQIICLENATTSEINNAVASILKQAGLRKGKGEIVLYYSGMVASLGTNPTMSLLPIDVNLNQPDNAISLQTILDKLGKAKVSRNYLFINGVSKGICGDGATSLPLKLTGNTVALFANDYTQNALPYRNTSHSIFTYSLLNNLGKASTTAYIDDLFKAVSADCESVAFAEFNLNQTPLLLTSPTLKTRWEKWGLVSDKVISKTVPKK